MVQLLEREILNNALADLRAEGYDVFLQPAKSLVPSFLGELRPDAIATRGDQGVVVEVEWSPSRGPSKVGEFRNAIAHQKDWKLRILVLNAADPEVDLPQQTTDRLTASLEEIKRLNSGKFYQPSLLLGWATFEALARKSILDRLNKPQSPVRLVDQLAQEGVLTPDEADGLRKLAKKRNSLIHGDLTIEVSSEDIEFFSNVLATLALEEAIRSPTAPKP